MSQQANPSLHDDNLKIGSYSQYHSNTTIIPNNAQHLLQTILKDRILRYAPFTSLCNCNIKNVAHPETYHNCQLFSQNSP